MECPKEIVLLMHSYFDGDLQPEGEQQLKEHLRSCAACAAHFHELKKTVAFLQYAAHVAAPPSFAAKVMEAMPKERKTARLRRFLHRHPLLTAASLFLALTFGSLASSWGKEARFPSQLMNMSSSAIILSSCRKEKRSKGILSSAMA